ncbi:hypothetical protein LWI28_015655 [Acer negundo]|uniref:Uncharacterized protein n=1 Tax=Acer negundo TaxID=4023 RepID=A0AAD5J9Q9_ACENE|nr:hypothetical protein LWI28_015655 [Acer negundo]
MIFAVQQDDSLVVKFSIVRVTWFGKTALPPRHALDFYDAHGIQRRHYSIMIGRRGVHESHQPQNRHEPPNRERDLRDIEVDDLRRQVQQLQQRLEHFEPLEHDESRHDLGNEPRDEENTNPIGRGYN